MVKSTRALLRTSLVARYMQLRDRLAARLGSQDLASEALHETWLRLESGSELSPVANPEAYLYRAALNNAWQLSARERRVLGMVEIDAILEVADDAPDPERVAIAKSEVAALRRILNKLTRRQRDVFLESYIGNVSHDELAARYKVSVRTIQSELREALLHVASTMMEKDSFAASRLRVSRK
jgi:RNA polymerase sigma factor (sigma-70 family)